MGNRDGQFRKTDHLLVEVSYEVCQQLGGIYTVLRSKSPSVAAGEKRRYCLVGPYSEKTALGEFEPLPLSGPFGKTVFQLRNKGIDARYGVWLVTGKPRVVLLNPGSAHKNLSDIKYFLWKDYGISTPPHDAVIDDVLSFGFLVEEFLRTLIETAGRKRLVCAHFHEWMGGYAIPRIRRSGLPAATVFTTHATLLGRYLAQNDPWFYDHLPFVDWLEEASRFNIEPSVRIERLIAHSAHVFTTVSTVTARECGYLLGREVDFCLPNGLNIERFVALHEFQNLHRVYKERINRFVMGHFFPSYSFDLDTTLYFFTSGRYEFRNKGFDLVVESLARLNYRLKQEMSEKTVVCFFITQKPYRSINPDVLSSMALLEEIWHTCESIQGHVGKRLFEASATGQIPKLDALVDEYWRLRLRRNVLAWRSSRQPYIVTHNLVDDAHDELLKMLRTCGLLNHRDDPVKVVYHPEFITSSNPLFGMEYDHFVRGCHLGIFPSYYEPWGYTPLECIARGIPAVTSDLSGFGSYVKDTIGGYEESGLAIVNRSASSFEQSAVELTELLLAMTRLDRKERIALRNRVQTISETFDWRSLIENYYAAYDRALERFEGGRAPEEGNP
jgi:glycogen(starch) synthase